MPEPQLVALSDAGYHALERVMTERAGGQVIHERGLLHVAGTHPAPYIVNGTTRLDRSIPAGETVERAQEYSARFGRRAVISTHRNDDDLEEALVQAGWELDIQLAGMVAVERVEPLREQPGVHVRQVATDADRHMMIDVLGNAFGPEPWTEIWESVFCDLRAAAAPDMTPVLALVDGEPAAAAVSYAMESVGVVGMVGTVPRFRRRGLGELVTRKATSGAQELGSKTVVLQSSPMAERMYAGIGFRSVTRYRVWLATDGAR